MFPHLWMELCKAPTDGALMGISQLVSWDKDDINNILFYIQIYLNIYKH